MALPAIRAHGPIDPASRQIEVRALWVLKYARNQYFYPESQNRENPVKLINLRGNLRNKFAQKLIPVLI